MDELKAERAERRHRHGAVAGSVLRDVAPSGKETYARHERKMRQKLTQVENESEREGGRGKPRVTKAAKSVATFESMGQGHRLLGDLKVPVRRGRYRYNIKDYGELYDAAAFAADRFRKAARKERDEVEKHVLNCKASQRDVEADQYLKWHKDGTQLRLGGGRSRSQSPIASEGSFVDPHSPESGYVGPHGFEGPPHAQPHESPSHEQPLFPVVQPQKPIPYSPPQEFHQYWAPGPPMYPPDPLAQSPIRPPYQAPYPPFQQSPYRAPYRSSPFQYRPDVRRASESLSQLSIGQDHRAHSRSRSPSPQRQEAANPFANKPGQPGFSPPQEIERSATSSMFINTRLPELQSTQPSRQSAFENEAGGPVPLYPEDERPRSWTAPGSSWETGSPRLN